MTPLRQQRQHPTILTMGPVTAIHNNKAPPTATTVSQALTLDHMGIMTTTQAMEVALVERLLLLAMDKPILNLTAMVRGRLDKACSMGKHGVWCGCVD